MKKKNLEHSARIAPTAGAKERYIVATESADADEYGEDF